MSKINVYLNETKDNKIDQLLKFYNQKLSSSPANYDMKTQYAELFGAKGHYQYSCHESIQAIRAYAQSETKKLEIKNT